MALLPSSGTLKLSQVITEYDRRTSVNDSGSATNTTVTVPTGTTMVVVELWGGGGTGGTATATVKGGGGGAGGYGFSMFTSGFTAGSSTITYYSGGSGVKSNITPSWTGTTITANQGNNGSGTTAGTGGTSTNAEYNVTGATGTSGAGGGAGATASTGRNNYGITVGTGDSAGGGGNGGNIPSGAGSAGASGKVKILFFGAPTANTMSTYTRYGNYVPNHSHNSGILVAPLSTSNRQKLTNYYGTARNYNSSLTIGSYLGFFTYYGYNNIVDLFGLGTPTFGSMTATTMGTSFSASTQTTISSLTEYYTTPGTPGGVYVLNLYLNPNTTGIYWSKLIINGTVTVNITDGGGSGTVGGPGSAYVNWSWGSATTFGLYAASGSKTIEFII